MRIVVYPHDLGIGGSQLNAIEIASAVRDLGNEVIVFGRPGPLVQHIERMGMEFVESPPPHRRPSPNVAFALSRLIASRGIDIVHGYEWPPALECLAATRLAPRASAVATVMSMSVAPFLPNYLPLAVGTRQIAESEVRLGRESVALIEPPVDLRANRPDGDFGAAGFRAKWGLDAGRYTVVMVSRLAHELKVEGVIAAISAVGMLAETLPVSLVIVGDGPARTQVEAEAERVNRVVGGGTIVLTGPLDDPRVAYSIADVSLGMGGSALRSLAFGNPLVVQGENGYWELLTPTSLTQFLWRGWYGVGTDPSRGPDLLATILRSILGDAELRLELGRFGLDTVRKRFSLEQAARHQVDIYEQARNRPVSGGRGDDIRAARAFVRYTSSRLADRLRGRLKSDDFNSSPVAASTELSETAGVSGASS